MEGPSGGDGEQRGGGAGVEGERDDGVGQVAQAHAHTTVHVPHPHLGSTVGRLLQFEVWKFESRGRTWVQVPIPVEMDTWFSGECWLVDSCVFTHTDLFPDAPRCE